MTREKKIYPYFPVGAIYFETTGVNPATTFGYGTWVQRGQGKYLVGIGADADFDTVGESGGAKTHTHVGHPALTHAGGAVGAIVATATSAVKVGTSASNAAAQGHTHPAPSFTQPNQHDAQGHDSPSHLSPYEVIGYVWERTA